MRSVIVIVCGAALLAAPGFGTTDRGLSAADDVPVLAPGGGVSGANTALQAGQADLALTILQNLAAPDNNTGEAHNIRCRVLYTLEQWDAAQPECEKAVALDSQNSMYHLWLGRVLGERADNASFMTAYSLAKRTRAEFEQAVQLNPRNAEALADLGEFYESAPGVVGGGTSKAESVAAQLDRVDPARAHELRGGIAQSNHDYVTAEREYRQAVAASPHPAFQWMRLASFFRKTKQFPQMENAVQAGKNAADHDRQHSGVALYNGASVLMRANRNTALAVKMLQQYLSSTDQTEEAPTFVAHAWLARLYKQGGDSPGAARERTAALGLASSYKPAQDLKV
jgi:tetratricopeptide (TPR) repeat protein